ncbi:MULTISPECIES: hypothetical protein [unclassified Microcoleus]|uniref:hypothetical protein n=1 Tax=unclassified Microcoleus TaxID=2642155 RepID=UPI004040879C
MINPNLKNVECCGGEINQVFMNILANAIDAIEESSSQKKSRKFNQIPTRFGFVRNSATLTRQLLKFMTAGRESARTCAIAFLTRFLLRSRSAKVPESACQLADTLLRI